MSKGQTPRKRSRKNSKTSIDDDEKANTLSDTYKLNIGGTRYEVSNSLLNQFPDSMLRKITSDTWKKAAAATTTNSTSENDLANPEIFIDRNGERFQYVLDYMRDGKVSLPLSVPRALLIADIDYFAIDYNDDDITLSVADPKDLFHGLGRYRDFFDARKLDIQQRYQKVTLEKFACDIASTYFSQLIHTPEEPVHVASRYSVSDKKCDKGICFFQQFTVKLPSPTGIVISSYSIVEELNPYLREFGLDGISSSHNYGGGFMSIDVALSSSTT